MFESLFLKEMENVMKNVIRLNKLCEEHKLSVPKFDYLISNNKKSYCCATHVGNRQCYGESKRTKSDARDSSVLGMIFILEKEILPKK